MSGCVLCLEEGGHLVYRSAQWRLVRATDMPAFPALYRVIWNAHVAEFSELSESQRSACMSAVATVESVLKAELGATKINLAALGNVVPHLHWHVIARFEWDSHFPAPVWASSVRGFDEARWAAVRDRLPQVDAALVRALTLLGV